MTEGPYSADLDGGGEAGIPRWERDLLAHWLREWRCEQVLGERLDGIEPDDDPFDGRVEPEDDRRAMGGADKSGGRGLRPPAIRQIRLLHPLDSGPSARPLFVALIARPAAYLFRIIPFGRFATPAVPGELATGRTQPPLRILCCWNARSVHSMVLARAWPVGRLTCDECAAADALDRHEDMAACAAGYAGRTGPRLRHPADPRHVYLRQESTIMDHVCREATFGPEGYTAVLRWPWPLPGDHVEPASERRAAEGSAAYGPRLAWRVPGRDVCLELDPPRTPNQPCRLSVKLADGSLSNRLDGVTVVGRRRLARIVSGCAMVLGADLLGGLRLYDVSGERVPLRER